MADEQFQEKSHQASPKRLRDAREKGQIPRSRDLNTALIVMGALILLLFFKASLSHNISEIMTGAFTLVGNPALDESDIAEFIFFILKKLSVAILPILTVIFMVAVISPVLLGGAVFNLTLLQPKAERISPLKGIKRLFALRNLVEVVKSLLKFCVLMSLGVLSIKQAFPNILQYSTQFVDVAITSSLSTLHGLMITVASGLFLFALLDVPYQMWDHQRKLKMTTQELKDEIKTTEGSPELKQRIRKTQQQLSTKRMLAEIPSASVIIINPEHYAVAIKYDPEQSGAPRVVAKGIDHMAMQIRKIGTAHAIPIVEAPPLARSVFYHTKLFDEIPVGLYEAVAKVLAYLHQLKRYHTGVGLKPDLTHSPIPEALKHDGEQT